MFLKIKNVSLFCIAFVAFILVQAQNYTDKKHYLIDSLDLKVLIPSDKKIIDLALTKYHEATHDSIRLKAITTIVDNSRDDNLCTKYNQWIYNYTRKRIKDVLLKNEFKNLKKEDEVLLKYYSNSIHNKGIAFYISGDLSNALAHYYKSLKLREKMNDNYLIADSYSNIASVYDSQGNVSKGILYNNKAIVIAKKNNYKEILAIVFSNLGVTYSKQGKIEYALKYHEKSLAINKELNNVAGVANALSLIGRIYKDKGELTEGLGYLNKSLKVIEKNEYQSEVISILMDISKIHLTQGAILKAQNTAERALNIAKEHGEAERIMITSSLLSIIYQKNNNWEKALSMQKLYVQMEDSIQNNEIEKNLIEQESEYTLDKKQQEVQLLSIQNEVQELKLHKNRTSIILISLALLSALIFIFLAYRGNKKKQYINTLLERQKEEISQKNEAKKTMLKEIHHRVKNNLQVVNSLLRMQSSKMDDENIVNMFKETQGRVRSMAKLHEKMYQSGDLKKLNAKEHVTMLIEEIVRSYSIDTNIVLDIDIEAIFVDSGTMMPLSLIINEMITNSLKYAFKGRENGRITVKINKISPTTNELYIADDGNGYVFEKVTEGLGSRLIQSFTHQLNGTIEKLNQSGTGYKITF